MEEKQLELLKLICKAFSFNSYDDSVTEISREDGKNAKETIEKLKDEILKLYPYDNTVKLRAGNIKTGRDSITVLSQLLRRHSMRVIPTKRRYGYNPILKRSYPKYNYRIIS